MVHACHVLETIDMNRSRKTTPKLVSAQLMVQETKFRGIDSQSLKDWLGVVVWWREGAHHWSGNNPACKLLLHWTPVVRYYTCKGPDFCVFDVYEPTRSFMQNIGNLWQTLPEYCITGTVYVCFRLGIWENYLLQHKIWNIVFFIVIQFFSVSLFILWSYIPYMSAACCHL